MFKRPNIGLTTWTPRNKTLCGNVYWQLVAPFSIYSLHVGVAYIPGGLYTDTWLFFGWFLRAAVYIPGGVYSKYYGILPTDNFFPYNSFPINPFIPCVKTRKIIVKVRLVAIAGNIVQKIHCTHNKVHLTQRITKRCGVLFPTFGDMCNL